MNSATVKSEKILNRYELPLFFLLTYLLSWWSAPFANGQIIPYGPALAAVITLAVTEGRPGLGVFWRRLTHWRVAWYWYLIGPAIILGYQGAAYLINVLSGAVVSQPPALPPMGILLELLLLGGMWEEPGWTGYALPKFQERFADRPNGRLVAALSLGVFRAIWHLPLLLYGHIPWFDVLIFSIAFQLIIAWIYFGSGGSVPAVMVLHFTSNIMGAMMAPVFTGAARTSFYAWFVALGALVAIALYAWPASRKKAYA
jgi:hypothetical protein